MDSEIASRTVDTHVKRLRDKLGTAGRYIETVRGVAIASAKRPPAIANRPARGSGEKKFSGRRGDGKFLTLSGRSTDEAGGASHQKDTSRLPASL